MRFSLETLTSVIRTNVRDRPGEFCYNFPISNVLTQMANFPTRFPDCDSHNPSLLDLFLSSDSCVCSAVAFPALINSDHVDVFDSYSIDFFSNSKRDAPFHYTAYGHFRADGLCDHLKDVRLEDIFRFGARVAATELCEWIQVGIDVNIPHRKYQVKPHSSSWFSVAFFCH